MVDLIDSFGNFNHQTSNQIKLKSIYLYSYLNVKNGTQTQ